MDTYERVEFTMRDLEKKQRDLEARIRADPKDDKAIRELAILMTRTKEIDQVFQYLIDKYQTRFLLRKIFQNNRIFNSLPADISSDLISGFGGPFDEEQIHKQGRLDYSNEDQDSYALRLISKLNPDVFLQKIKDITDFDEFSQEGSSSILDIIDYLMAFDLQARIAENEKVFASVIQIDKWLFENLDENSGDAWRIKAFLTQPVGNNANDQYTYVWHDNFMSKEVIKNIVAKSEKLYGIKRVSCRFDHDAFPD